jgi:chromosome segregation ATPase
MATKKGGDGHNKRLRSQLTPDEQDKRELSISTMKGLMMEIFEDNGLLELSKDLKEIKEMKKEIGEIKQSLESTNRFWEDTKAMSENNKEEIKGLKTQIEHLEDELKQEKMKRERLEMAHNRN